MLKKEFTKLAKLHKKGWSYLAKTGADSKIGIGFDDFISLCPACEVALRATPRGEVYKDCRLCPIVKWRDSAKEPYSDYMTFCLQSASDYDQWYKSRNVEDRKKFAKIIASRRWRWLPEYEGINLNGGLCDES